MVCTASLIKNEKEVHVESFLNFVYSLLPWQNRQMSVSRTFPTEICKILPLCFVVLIAISRYIHTRHMIRVKYVITHTRVNIAAICSLGIASTLSTVSLAADSDTNVDVYLQIKIFETLIGVILNLTVVFIYRRSELVAKRRKAASNYTLHFTSYSEKVLRKIMMSTLFTLLPLRIPFFCSTVIKAVVSDKRGQNLSWWMQFTHLGCYSLFCLTAGANGAIFLYNNQQATKLISKQWTNALVWIGFQKRSN